MFNANTSFERLLDSYNATACILIKLVPDYILPYYDFDTSIYQAYGWDFYYYFKAVPKVQIVAYRILMCPLKNVCASFICMVFVISRVHALFLLISV